VSATDYAKILSSLSYGVWEYLSLAWPSVVVRSKVDDSSSYTRYQIIDYFLFIQSTKVFAAGTFDGVNSSFSWFCCSWLSHKWRTRL